MPERQKTETEKEREQRLEKRRARYLENRDKLRQQDREFREKHRDRINKAKRERYAKDPETYRKTARDYAKRNPEKVHSLNKAWKSKNKERLRNYMRSYCRTEKFKSYCNNRYANDPEFRIKTVLRSRLYVALKGKCKSASTIQLLGCSIQKLQQHIEKQFLTGMSWENYGEWHIDHRFPCASFDLMDPKQQRACFHWSNLQPMWATENRKKKDKFVLYA